MSEAEQLTKGPSNAPGIILVVWLIFTGLVAVAVVAHLGKRWTPEQAKTAMPLVLEDAESAETPGAGSAEIPEVLTLTEFQSFLKSKRGLVADARPEIFYRTGHIPGAVSLPRDEFEEAYSRLLDQKAIEPDTQVVIYCSSSSCEDSDRVREKLIAFGHGKVSIFKGGWSEWTSAELPIQEEG